MNPQLQEVMTRIQWIARSIDNRDGKAGPEDLLNGLDAAEELLPLVKELGDPDIIARVEDLATHLRAKTEFAFLTELLAVVGAYSAWKTFEFALTMTSHAPRESEMPLLEPVFQMFREMTAKSGESEPGTPESFRAWMARADRWETIAGEIRETVKRRWKERWTPDLDPFFEGVVLPELQERSERIKTDLRKILEAHPEMVPDADAEK
jgi:hypothetical protein